jgi:hypothetical protein
VTNVRELRPGDLTMVKHDAVIDPEQVIDQAKGRFEKVFIVGVGDGQLVVLGSHSMLDCHWVLTKALREIEGCYSPKEKQ